MVIGRRPEKGKSKRDKLLRWGKAVDARIERVQTAVLRARVLERNLKVWGERALQELEKKKPNSAVIRSAELMIKETIENWGNLLKHDKKLVKDAKNAGAIFSTTFEGLLPEMEKIYSEKIKAAQEILNEIRERKRERGLGG